MCSEAAVWVVRGKLGLMDYRNRRKQEIYERGTSQGGSRFHDGKKLLQTVETTHNRLLTKGEVRPGDRVTLPILDQLVDSMLEVKPEARLDAIQLWKRSDRLFQTVQLELQELTFPPRRSSTFTRIAESDLSETESTASSMWSDSSKSSASSSASTNDTFEAALDEVIDVFVSDKDLRSLFAEAFIGQNRVKFSRNAVRLLKWLGRRLMVAANTPAEKEAAKFFLSRRHDQAIIDRIAIGMITQSSKQEKQGQIKDLPQHESTKQERLESYLQQMEMSTTSREPEETGKVLSDGESDSSSDSDEEKDRKQTAQWKVFDVVKLFLKSGDAFARFKEELEDLISPFRSESMWTKELWNGRERVRFEHSNNVPRLTMIDKLKLAVEEMLGLPILWWPLKQPRKHLPSSKVRIIWICVGRRSSPYQDSSTN